MKNSEGIKESDPYNFLLLSLYYYLKKHNYDQTAQKLFQEGKLDSIFKFPHDLKPPSNEKEKMQNEFIEFFYNNSFNNPNFDFLGDFWSQFWSIFANKMINNTKTETLFNKEQKNIMKHTYCQKNISQNFFNAFPNKDNNDTKSVNFISNISKNTNNNNIGETEEILNMMSKNYGKEQKEKNNINKNYNQMNKNNPNIFEEEEEEEGENDIEKEMDEENGFSFTKQKNCPNIIKHPNGIEMPRVELSNEFENDINKHIYQGFQNNNNSLSNFDFNALNGNNNSKEERNMSAIPLSKDVGMENNNNDFNI